MERKSERGESQGMTSEMQCAGPQDLSGGVVVPGPEKVQGIAVGLRQGLLLLPT